MIGHDFPYLDTRDLNLNWLLKNLKRLILDYNAYKEANDIRFTDFHDDYELFKKWVQNYFENLDVSQEIGDKLDDMLDDGDLTNIMYEQSKYPLYGSGNTAAGRLSSTLKESVAPVNGTATDIDVMAQYYNRDAVLNCVISENYNDDSFPIGIRCIIQDIGANYVTVDADYSEYIKEDMYIHLFTTETNDLSDGYVGVITGNLGEKIFVNEWKKMGTGATEFPEGVEICVINPITRLYNNYMVLRDNANSGFWYREGLGYSLDIYRDSDHSIRTIGNAMYIRRAVDRSVIPYLISNTSGTTLAHVFDVIGNFDSVLAINGVALIDGDARLRELKVKPSNIDEHTIIKLLESDFDCSTLNDDCIYFLYNNTTNSITLTYTGGVIRSAARDISSYVLERNESICVYNEGSYLIVLENGSFSNQKILNPANNVYHNGLLSITADITASVFEFACAGLIVNTTGTDHVISGLQYALVDGTVTSGSITIPKRTLKSFYYDKANNNLYLT